MFAIVGMVLTIPYMSFYNGRGAEALESRKDNDNYTATTSSSSEEKVDYNKKYTWPQNGLLTKLSKPSSQFGEVSYSEDDEANAIIYQVSEDDYQKYVQECKKKGFTEYADSSTEEYEAWNKNNDFLELSYDSDKSTYSISVTAQHEMKDISWPKGQLAKSLPTPKKLHGYIAEDSSDSLSIYIDNVSEKDFNTYVDDCLDKGYDSDYYRYDDSFHGTNNKHEKRDLSVERERNKVMHIYLMDWEL